MGTLRQFLEQLRDLDTPTLLALVEKFPGEREGVDAVLRGEKKIILQDVIRPLVDKNGRCIPAHLGVQSKVRNENRAFRVVQPDIANWTAIRERFSDFCQQGTEFMAANEAEDRLENKKEEVMQNELIANLFKRAHLPIFLPQYTISDYGAAMYGAAMQEFFIPAARKAYKKVFSNRSFNNYQDGEMANNFSLVEGVGHDKLLAAMEKSPAVAWYFPHPLQGFSVHAQREAMQILSQHGLLLTGAIELTLGIVGFVEAMVGNYNTPGYDCSAVSYNSADYSFCFVANEDEYFCYGRGGLGGVRDCYSGGLVLLG